MVWWLLIHILGRMWKETICGITSGTITAFTWIMWWKSQSTLVRTAGVPAEIWTRHLPEMRQKQYWLRKIAQWCCIIWMDLCFVLMSISTEGSGRSLFSCEVGTKHLLFRSLNWRSSFCNRDTSIVRGLSSSAFSLLEVEGCNQH